MEQSPRSHRPIDRTLDRSNGAAAPDQMARLAALNARAGRRPTRPPVGPPPFIVDAPVAATGTEKPRTRRRHAARGARATALGLSLASTGALAALFALTSTPNSGGNQVAAASIVTTTPTTASTATAATTATTASGTTAPVAEAADTSSTATTPTVTTPDTTSPASSVPVAESAAATTVVDGATYSNKWGEVQVEATFAADGTLVDVTTLQTPYRDGKSVRINERAAPRLNAEALTAQSANVDTVSGATYTSNDYRRSLQSAIDAANAAGITTLV